MVKRANNKSDLILDTSAPPLVLDVNSKEEITVGDLLESQKNTNEKMNITFSLEKWKVNTLKQAALNLSIKNSNNTTYTDLIKEAIEARFFVEDKKELQSESK